MGPLRVVYDTNVLVSVAGGADYIVSGDDHVLEVGSYQDIEIATPAEFLSTHS